MNLLRLLVVYGSLVTATHSHTIDCKSEGIEQHARLICDYTILNNNYEKIFEDQNRKLATGELSSEVLTTWNSELSDCQTVTCIDHVFEKWNQLSLQIGEKHPQKTRTTTTTETTQTGIVEKFDSKKSPNDFYIYLALLGYLIQKDFRKKDGRTSNGYKNNAPSPSIWRRLIGWSIVCFSLYNFFHYL